MQPWMQYTGTASLNSANHSGLEGVLAGAMQARHARRLPQAVLLQLAMLCCLAASSDAAGAVRQRHSAAADHDTTQRLSRHQLREVAIGHLSTQVKEGRFSRRILAEHKFQLGVRARDVHPVDELPAVRKPDHGSRKKWLANLDPKKRKRQRADVVLQTSGVKVVRRDGN